MLRGTTDKALAKMTGTFDLAGEPLYDLVWATPQEVTKREVATMLFNPPRDWNSLYHISASFLRDIHEHFQEELQPITIPAVLRRM